jgi:hypothetical protein
VLSYLRIAMTALSLTACVVLIVMWIRSYRIYDDLSGNIRNGGVLGFGSMRGRVSIEYFPDLNLARGWRWWHDEPDKDQIRAHNKVDHVTGFNLYTHPEGGLVLVPHWFPVSLTAILGVLTWSKGSRRFSLRTLLIATTLVAFGIGAIVYVAR